METYSKRYTEEYKNRFIVRLGTSEYKVFNKFTGKQVSLLRFTDRTDAKQYIDKVAGNEPCQAGINLHLTGISNI